MMSRREGSFTFSFSQRNEDVKNIVDNYKKIPGRFIVTDYMCEAVRFYEKHKGSITLNGTDIEQLVSSMIDKRIGTVNNVKKEEQTTVNYIKSDIKTDIEELDDSCLDDD